MSDDGNQATGGNSAAVSVQAAESGSTTATLDHANLPDGHYTVNIKMMYIGRNGKVSMSNGALDNVVEGTDNYHQMTLDVVDGEYWMTMHWVPLTNGVFTGYLANIQYYENYDASKLPITGTAKDASVSSWYVNADGSRIYDDYNDPSKTTTFKYDGAYPKDLQIKISGSALEDGWQPVHVFVPVMEAIQTGSGDQDAYVQIDWDTLAADYLTADKTALKSALDTANALEQGKKSDDVWNTLKSAIKTAQDVYDSKTSTQDDITNAAKTLNDAVKAFQDSPDTGADAAADPFDGIIDDGPFYIANQKFVDESGNAIASSDAAFNQTSLNIRRVDSAEGRYEVKLQTRYTDSAGPVITSVSYGAVNGAVQSAKTAVKVRDDVNGSNGYHTVEWRIYVDDLSQQQKLNVQYTTNGEAKSQALYITPLNADAKLGTMVDVFNGTADFYRTSNYLDATGLFLAIEDAKAVEKGKKTEGAWEDLQKAIETAQTVYDNKSKQQADCDEAVETLNAAVKTFNNSANDASATFGMEAGVWHTNSTEAWSGTKQGIGGTTPFDTQSVRYKVNDDGTFTVRVKTYGKLYAVTQVAYGSADQVATKTGQWNQGLGSKGADTTWDFTVSDLSQVTAYVTGTYQNGTSLKDEPFTLSISGLAAGGDYGFAKAAVQLDDGDLYQAWARGKALTRDPSKLDAYQQLQSALTAAEGVRSKVTTSMKNGTESITQSEIDAATKRVNEAIEAYEASAADPLYGMEKGVFYSHLRLNDHVEAEEGSGVTDAPISIGKSTFRVTDDEKFEVTLACPEVSGNSGASIESIKVGTSNSILDASEPKQVGGGAGLAQYRFTVDSLSDGIYAWITYTDAAGTKHSNVRFLVTLDLSETDGSYGFTKLDNQEDSVVLFTALRDAVNDAQSIEYGKKAENLWVSLCDARKAAAALLDSPKGKTQVEVDAATKAVSDAASAYREAADDPNGGKYGFEVGECYTSYGELMFDSDGKQIFAGDENNPFYYQGLTWYGLNEDGSFYVKLMGYDKDGENSISSVKWSYGSDLSAAEVAPKIDGRVGSYTPGPAYWLISSVEDISQPLHLWVTYTDKQGVEHESTPITIELPNLSKTADHYFVHQAKRPDTSQLYQNLKRAEAVTKKANKTDIAWTTFELLRETYYSYYADSAAGDTQANIDDAAKQVADAISAYENSADVVVVNKDALKSAIDAAKAITKGNKTDSAWNDLRAAITKAENVYKATDASQDAVNAAVTELNTAVDNFNKSADAAQGLDFNNLEDGTYTVNVDMYQVSNPDKKSMSDQAINHEVELTVKNGEYYLTFDFQGLKYLGQFGYLGWLKYYDQGYTYSQYGSPTGEVVDATVLSTQKNADGSDVYDDFNRDGSKDKQFSGLYPDKVQVKYVQTARDDAEGYIPLQVFVPVMESLGTGNGTQDVLAKVDKSSLKKKEAAAVDTTSLQTAIASAENALATSKKSDADNAKLSDAVKAAKAALANADATQDDIDAALNTLNTAIDAFKKAPDAVVVDKSKLADAIAKAEAVKQGNKTDSAWETLQAAIAKAKGTNSSADATQADVDTATTTLNNAVSTFNASADKAADSNLDFANLPAGTYSINIDMYKMNRTDKSMSDAAINHKAKLTVDANGDYWLTLDFASVKSGTTNGYLGSLSYYDDGYTYSGAKVNGTLVAGNVIDYQTGVDGKQYPNHVTVKFVKTARNDADHFIPLQVFVPVMEEIATDCGTQDVLAKYDPSSIQKLDGEIPDQTEPGMNGDGTTTTPSTPNTVAGPSAATKSGVSAATTAAKTASLSKTGDDVNRGLLISMFAGAAALMTAAAATMRRRFGKQEGEE